MRAQGEGRRDARPARSRRTGAQMQQRARGPLALALAAMFVPTAGPRAALDASRQTLPPRFLLEAPANRGGAQLGGLGPLFAVAVRAWHAPFSPLSGRRA